MGPLIRSAVLTDYARLANSVGIDPLLMIVGAGLPRSCLRTPDLRISVDAVVRLLEESAKVAGIDDFGLRLADGRSLSNLGPLGLVIREQPTIRKAIETAIQFIGLHTDSLVLRVKDEGEIVTINPVLMIRQPVLPRQTVGLTIGVIYRILSAFLGETWKPEAVCFTHSAPKNRDASRRLFGASVVQFGRDFNGIVCKARDLKAPIRSSDPTMARYVQQYVESIAPPADSKMIDAVRDLAWDMLKLGNCSVERIAEHLGVDRRTVHRRLALEGETFSSIMDAIRTEMVARHLENEDRPLFAVAEILGFS